MDSRLTLHANENFQHILEAAFRDQEKVYLIVDDTGFNRVEGLIKQIGTENSRVVIQLNDDTKIFADKIIAVNGIFLPDYGEC